MNKEVERRYLKSSSLNAIIVPQKEDVYTSMLYL